MMNQQINQFESIQVSEIILVEPWRFPCRPKRTYNHTVSEPINKFTIAYHCEEWIRVEDHIHFHETEEYLKRFYGTDEHQKKIALLGEYYRFHEEAPRIFMGDIARIMESHTEEKRNLEYKEVGKWNERAKQQQAPRSARIQPHKKLLKDIELSYENFENKPDKKPKQRTKQKTDVLPHERRTMKRVISIHGKELLGVLKPKNGHYIRQVNPKETKYKKPKTQNLVKNKNESKKSECKKITNIHSQKPSANNSVASNKNMSRSKSKTNLHCLQPRKFGEKSEKNLVLKGNNVRSAHSSQQNSFLKNLEGSESRGKMLLLRTHSKNNLKDDKNSLKSKQVLKIRQGKTETENRVIKSVSSASNLKKIKPLQPSQKQKVKGKCGMFRKVIETKKRCI